MYKKHRKTIQTIIAVLLLLAIWQAAALLVDQSLLLCGPLDVAKRLLTIWREDGFFASIWFSFRKIAGGFLLAFTAGVLLAFAAGRFPFVDVLMQPVMAVIRSVPVASFIIIALVWLSSADLSIFISFLIVLPALYSNTLTGIRHIDPKLLQMAELFQFSFRKKFIYIWLPSIKPYLMTASAVALGMAWKAGIAAEVIGIPSGSIGEHLYEAKAYLNTTDLFAWTVVIVVLSILFEKLFLTLLKTFYKYLETK